MSWLSYSSLIPPNLFILLTVIGVVLAWRWTRFGLVVATVGGALLYLAAMPIVADGLTEWVKSLAGAAPILPSDAPPAAIIVLSADYRRSDAPDASYTVGPQTLERLAAAAREARRLGLPVLVSGGRATAQGLIESGTALIGSPETVLAGIERMHERTGFGILVALLQFGVLSDELTRRNMDLFATEVMPCLRG